MVQGRVGASLPSYLTPPGRDDPRLPRWHLANPPSSCLIASLSTAFLWTFSQSTSFENRLGLDTLPSRVSGCFWTIVHTAVRFIVITSPAFSIPAAALSDASSAYSTRQQFWCLIVKPRFKIWILTRGVRTHTELLPSSFGSYRVFLCSRNRRIRDPIISLRTILSWFLTVENSTSNWPDISDSSAGGQRFQK